MRFLVGGIRDWVGLFKEAFRALRPGGYVESQEPSTLLQGVDEGSALGRWGKIFTDIGKKNDRPFDVYETCIQQIAMREAGFVDMGVQELVVSKDFGRPLTGTDDHLF